MWGSIFKTTQLRGGQFILKTFGCKKKSKSKKNKQNKWINNFENLNSSKHFSVKDMRVRGDIQYNV